MNNYWSILPSSTVFEYTFILNDNQYDVNVLIQLLDLIVSSGRKYEVFSILNAFDQTDLSSKFLEQSISNILGYEKKGTSIKEKFEGYDFFIGTTPCVYEGFFMEDYNKDELFFQSYCKLASYDEDGMIEVNNIFHVSKFYTLLNPHRISLYHEDETGTSAPIDVELYISNRKLLLHISSGLGIWSPYFKPDYDINSQKLEDFPIDSNGYIDNRELYLLNTPRLIGFIKEIRLFFKEKNGIETSNNTQIEELPIFPRYL